VRHRRLLVVLISCVILPAGLLPAQPKSSHLYLVRGCPFSEGPSTFATVLYRVTRKQLEEVRTITSTDQGSEFVRDYQDHRLILIQQAAGYDKGEAIKFHLVWMDEPEKADARMVKMAPGMIYTGANLVNLPNKGLSVAAQVALDGKRTLMGLPLAHVGEQQPLPWTAYRDVVLMGNPGVATGGSDRLFLSQDTEGGLVQRIGALAVVKMTLGLLAPPRLGTPVVSLFINDHLQAAVVSARNREELAAKEDTTIWVADKSGKRWREVTIAGAVPSFRALGAWLGGYVSFKYLENPPPSPGFEDRPQGVRSNGIPVDLRLKDAGCYAPGILLLYSAEKGRLIKLETGNGDSEILLVDGDNLLYRIDRQICTAKIGPAEITDKAVLVEHDSIRDVHWAFFGP
jgi:hypothetical protein